MNLQQLFERLEISTPEDFEYYEQFAELIECEESIEFDDFYTAMSKISALDLGEIMENYFEELSNALPDNTDTGFFTQMDNIKTRLLSMAEKLDEEENSRSVLAEELYHFREWYREPGKVTADGQPMSVMDALFANREDALTGGKRTFDFTKACDYGIEDMTMDLGSFRKIDVVRSPEEKAKKNAGKGYYS